MSAAVKAGGNVIYSVGSWRLSDDGSIHRQGRLKYSTGDVYDGEWVDGKRHGQGVLTFGSGGCYRGQFVNDLFEGVGVLEIPKCRHSFTKLWQRGEKYEGEFYRGLKHGRGTWQTRGGDQYDGELKKGLYDGRGVCVYGTSGDVYDGEFVRGLRYGQGEVRFRNGSTYKGGFRLDDFHGFGRMTYGPHGSQGSYVGEFVNGKRHGQGLRVYGSVDAKKTNRRRYEGSWEDDEPHGPGVLERDGWTAVGTFERGLQKGPGVMRFANGNTYDGNFDKGTFHGKGRLVYSNGSVYEGMFLCSKRHGQGTCVSSHGDRYEGDWVDDQMHGHGVYTSTIVKKFRGGKGGGSGVKVYTGSYCNGHQTGKANIVYEFTRHLPESKEHLEMKSPMKTLKNSCLRSDCQGQQGNNWQWHNEFEFPEGSGYWHHGQGQATYEGGVLRGRFHGQGCLRSPDGKLWRGEWVHGKLHGRGERVYLPLELDTITTKEELDEDRASSMLAVEGRIGMYHIVQYVGEFMENVRHGQGELLYADGFRLRGHFINGFVDGVACYGFCGRWRYGEFVRGERKRWLTEQEEAEKVLHMQEQETAEDISAQVKR